MNILILSSGCFPYGGAYASRLLNFCRSMKLCKHDIHVITWFNSAVKADDSIMEICSYEHITDIHERTENYKLPYKLVKKAEEYISANKVDCIISNRMPIGFGSLLKLIKKAGAPLALEQCEWIDPSNYKYGKFHPMYFFGECNMRKKYKKADGIIAISRLLETHFLSQGVKTIRIPTILDTTATEFDTETYNTPTMISYCGSPGVSKENLENIMIALRNINSGSVKVVLNIYGPDKNAVLKNIGYNEELLAQTEGYVNIYKNIPQTQVAEIMRKSDYTFFARPDRNSSNAGFPTKFAESMACATPVITNLTGDIGLYLEDRVNGHVLPDISPECIEKKLREIIGETRGERVQLRANARKTAELSFDYHIYSEKLENFLIQLKGKTNESK